MKFTRLSSALAAAAILSGTVAYGQTEKTELFRSAKALYDNCMYESARSGFEKVGEDALAEGYAVLCALKLDSGDAADMMDAYLQKYNGSELRDEINFRYALNLFDDREYSDALDILANRVNPSSLRDAWLGEYMFKKGYCEYSLGEYSNALGSFMKLTSMERNTHFADYAGAANYLSGCIYYDKNFAEHNYSRAEYFFSCSALDHTYGAVSRFYLVDCRFNLKDYDYVIEEGTLIYDSQPRERQEHLARLISESYLVKDEPALAREYYDKASHGDPSAADYYYAGSLMYSNQDYPAAADNYSKYLELSPSRDSLWQIASYQLANCHMQTRNQVAALDAFKSASELDCDPAITEDACFNYAKLAFDINKDTSGFDTYLRKYFRENNDDIYRYMALAALYDRDYQRAIDAYDKMDSELSPELRLNYAKASYLRAKQQIASGALTDAVKNLKATAYYIPASDRFNQLARYWEAEAYFRNGDYSAARELYAGLYNSSSLYGAQESELLPYNIAYCDFKSGEYGSARKWFETYLDSGNTEYRVDALLRSADCLFASRSYKEAAPAYQKAISVPLDPNHIYPYYMQALSLGLAKDVKSKIKVLSNVESANPESKWYNEAMYELGNTLLDTRDAEGAERVFLKLRNTTHDSTYVARALLGLGMLYRNGKNYDKSLASFKEVVSMMPGSEYADNAFSAIESIYQTIGIPEEYTAYRERIAGGKAESDEDKEKSVFGTAEQIYMAGRWKDASDAFLAYMDKYPDNSRKADVYFYLGSCCKSLSNNEKACEYFKRSLDEGNGRFTSAALMNYASVCASLERYAESYDAYSTLWDASADDDERLVAASGQMRSAFRSRRFEEAANAAKRVASLPGCDEALSREAGLTLGKSLLPTSRRSEAAASLEKLAASAPETAEGAEARYLLIMDLYNQGRFDDVESAVYEHSAKSGNQVYWLAKMYTALGDSFAERKMYSQAKATFESIRDGYIPFGVDDDVPDGIKMRLEKLSFLMEK